MRRRTRLSLACLAATIAMAAAGESASARSFRVNEEGFRLIWPSFSVEAGLVEVTCSVTLAGEFQPDTIPKRAGELMAFVTSSSVGTCQDDSRLILLVSGEKDIDFVTWAGTLPAITAIAHYLVDIPFAVSDPDRGIECLAVPSYSKPIFLSTSLGAGGTVTSVQTGFSSVIDFALSEDDYCAFASARVEGRGSMKTSAEAAFTYSLI